MTYILTEQYYWVGTDHYRDRAVLLVSLKLNIQSNIVLSKLIGVIGIVIPQLRSHSLMSLAQQKKIKDKRQIHAERLQTLCLIH